jgi:two-component system, OmpR family, response regulator VicR
MEANNERKSILLVEDDHGVALGICYALKQDGWEVTEASTAAEARKYFAEAEFDLAILDIGLPDGTGFDLCKEWRQNTSMPILFLTARDMEADKVLGLELGGDDYVTKPFGVRELCARIRALYRRSASTKQSIEQKLTLKDLTIDFEKRKVYIGAENINLTHTEFEILKNLSRNPDKVFTREELIEKIWDINFFGGAKTIDVHIRNLRKKLGENYGPEGYIETVRGLGYKWRVDE